MQIREVIGNIQQVGKSVESMNKEVTKNVLALLDQMQPSTELNQLIFEENNELMFENNLILNTIKRKQREAKMEKKELKNVSKMHIKSPVKQQEDADL